MQFMYKQAEFTILVMEELHGPSLMPRLGFNIGMASQAAPTGST